FIMNLLLIIRINNCVLLRCILLVFTTYLIKASLGYNTPAQRLNEVFFLIKVTDFFTSLERLKYLIHTLRLCTVHTQSIVVNT
ncbi:hypothetical protein L9F63_001624, partial [Diploptera punctata]